jgi:hypothetical protein
MRYLILLLLTGCAAMGFEHTIKATKGMQEQAPKPEVSPGKHHCDTGEEVECCCIRDTTGKISNCTCVEK